jgi:putative redox protein
MGNIHQVNAVYSEGMAFNTTLDGHPVVTDTSVTNHGPRPKALMLVSLIGCSGIDVVSILNKMRVIFSGFSIEARGELTDEEAAVYHTVTLIYTIKVENSDRAKVEKAVELSQEKYCGVAAMFRKFARLNKEIIFL